MPRDRTTQQLHKRLDDHGQNDLTDAEWTVIGLMPPKRGRMGRPRGVDLRPVSDAGRYILSTGCRWRALPSGYPPFSTDRNPFSRMAAERAPGAYRASSPGPRAAVSGALRGADRRPGRQPVGEDHGERRPPRPPRRQEGEGEEKAPDRGRRRHAGRHDGSHRRHPGPGRRTGPDRGAAGDGAHGVHTVCRPFADGGHPGPKPRERPGGMGLPDVTGTVERPEDVKGFTVLHRRWVVERTFAWMGR